MTSEQKMCVNDAMIKVIERIAEKEDATAAEVEALAAVARVLWDNDKMTCD